ncbi:MAG: hypothetical protein AAGF97_18965, partial [Planctomycetota bacterium]
FGLLVATVMVLILIPTFYFVYQRLIHGAVLQPFSSDSPAVDSLANEVPIYRPPTPEEATAS